MAIHVLSEPKEPSDRLVAGPYVAFWAIAAGVLAYAAPTGRLF